MPEPLNCYTVTCASCQRKVGFGHPEELMKACPTCGGSLVGKQVVVGEFDKTTVMNLPSIQEIEEWSRRNEPTADSAGGSSPRKRKRGTLRPRYSR